MSDTMKFFLAIVVCVILVVAGCTGCQTKTMQQGTKDGTVVKLSQQGFLDSCKTWEGELIRGGMNGGSGAFSMTPLYFTVNDPKLLEETRKALDEQYEVEVTFVEYFGPMPCASNSRAHFLTGIRRR